MNQSKHIIKTILLASLLMVVGALMIRTMPAEAATCDVYDAFGYHLICSTIGSNWKDASADGGALIPFDKADDELSALIPIGFPFKYYENSYSGIYVSSNGALFFTWIETPESLWQERIPRSKKPNNLLAPFWDDLYVGGSSGDINKGEVYYKLYGSSPNRYFVIQYKDVTLRSEGTSPLNFEVILRENGEIDFLYLTLTGTLDQASVGIEDQDGVIGLQYLFQEAGLNDGLALQFVRPGDGPRIKALAEVESSLVVGGKAEVKLTFRNVGDQVNDIIQFPKVTLPPGWQYQLVNPTTKVDLPDTDGNGIQDSGVLSPGADIVVLVRISAPKNAVAGDKIDFKLIAQSKTNTSRTAHTDLRFAVPPPFAYAYSRPTELNGMTYGVASSNSRVDFKLVVNHTSSSMGIIRLTGNRIFYIWEKAGQNSLGTFTTYLTAMILNEFGGVSRNAWVPTNNDYNNVSVLTTDISPTLAEDPGRNHNIGIFYRHDQNSIDNLYLTVLSSNGNNIPSLGNFRNITNQATSKPYDYTDPVIAATQDGHFVLAWTATDSGPSGSAIRKTNIWTAAYDASTLAQIKAPSQVTNAVDDSKAYGDPVLVALDDGRVFLSYSVFDNTGTYTGYVEWVPLNSSGNTIDSAVNYKSIAPTNDPETTLQKDATQLYNGGPILLGWVDSSNEIIHAILVNNAMTNNFSPLLDITTPNNRAPSNLSLTNTREGLGVLMWQDATSSQYIFYNLISSIGEDLSGPITLVKTEQEGIQPIAASVTAQGLVPIAGFNRLMLPAVMNKYTPGLMSADADEEEIWQP